jgi:hypothetical protein
MPDINPTSSEPLTNMQDASGLPWYAKGKMTPVRILKGGIRQRIGSIIAIVVVGLLVVNALSNPSSRTRAVIGGGIVSPATLSALAEGCGGIVAWPSSPPSQIGWVESAPRAFYWNTLPPVSGNFAKVPWQTAGYINPARSLQMTASQSLANMYRGWTVVWMARNITQDTQNTIRSWVDTRNPGAPVVVGLWPFNMAQLWPEGKIVIFTSWNRAEGCTTFSPKVAEEFRVAVAAFPAPGIGVPLDTSGPKARIRSVDTLSH